MTSRNETLTTDEQGTLREIVTREAVSGTVMVVVGELSGEAAQVMLADIAHVDGKMICVNSFPEVIDEAAEKKRNPNGLSREEFLRFVRKGGYRESVTLVNGDVADLAELFAPETIDLLFMAVRGGYEAQRTAFLAWFPALRQGGVVFGTGFEAGDPAEGYAAVVVDSETVVPGVAAPRAVARLVTDMVPGATVSGQIWAADKGLGQEATAMVASGMHRTKIESNRTERKHRSLLKKALQIGERANTHRERIGILVQIARDFPQYLEPHVMLGEQFMDLQLVDEAIRVYERSLKNKMGNASLYGKLAMAYKVKGEDGTAEAYFLASLRCDRTHLPSWLSLAMLYVESGRAERAVDAVAHALDVCPPEIEQVGVLCRMALALGDREIMAKSLQLMRRLDPDHEAVDKLSKRIAADQSKAPSSPTPAVAGLKS